MDVDPDFQTLFFTFLPSVCLSPTRLPRQDVVQLKAHVDGALLITVTKARGKIKNIILVGFVSITLRWAAKWRSQLSF